MSFKRNVSKNRGLKKNTAGIILAAGMSKRFGSPKQLARIQGERMINRVIDACLDSNLDPVVAVLGARFDAVLAAIGERVRSPRLAVARNFAYRQGLSASLRAGLGALKSPGPVMFVHGDQPFVSAAVINEMLEKFNASDKQICFPALGGKQKTPTLFSETFFFDLLGVTGDAGAREIIRQNLSEALVLEMKAPLPFFDIDTPEDLERVRSYLKNPAGISTSPGKSISKMTHST
ncbi:putative MobA-related glycosyltransferase [Candidatus Desulfarcum epimagneticum]|uniref:Putative MobA-related glycosyltransferase n=1 Tax=uncultured Desulfobacteraceae bacterium TaxID=218296 RepID=A0A484HGR2_9BACT|nr:putative MobA-related glycosyltransferase [uncultured Desulfobacteraceae bacterium]